MNFFTHKGRGLLVTLATFAAIAVLLLTPAFFKVSAVESGTSNAEESDKRFGDYDIRRDKGSAQKIAEFRGRALKNANDVTEVRSEIAQGESLLRSKVPGLKIEYNHELRVPETIGTDVREGKQFLTPPSQSSRREILMSFLKEHSGLTGMEAGSESQQLRLAVDEKNPGNSFAIVEYRQELNEIPVFQGSVKAGFAKNNEIIRVINKIAPGLDASTVSTEFGSAENALAAAATSIDREISAGADPRSSTSSTVVFGGGDFAPSAQKIYFPTEPAVAVPAWGVIIWEPINAYYIIVDANSGTLLWRKNITDAQTQSVTYNVYANPNAMMNVAESPFPFSPGGPTSPNGIQGSPLARTSVTRIGNEAPYTFNSLGWITDGNNTTDGNNVEAGLDRENPNPSDNVGIDPNGEAVGSPSRVFDFPIGPGVPSNPILNTGGAPLPAGQSPVTCQAQGSATAPSDFQKAAVTQLFYISNWYHDEMYRLGFTEASGNFQNDNFGRGGNGGDRVSAEAQDCGGTNNANFATPPDGSRGRMQMYIWTSPSPDFDGSLDAEIVIHELTHGLSNRLINNGSGLSGLNMSRALGEGWSDFYAHCLLSEPTDPINGIYPLSGYATYRFRAAPNDVNNYYYGIRRFPKAVMSFTGPNGRPHNPLTFNDIDVTKINISDGAFASATSPTADGVHAAGEVWSSALWEIRARYIARLGWEAGNRRILQHVTDGMKLTPSLPTFLQARDAIVAGVLATGTPEDIVDIWAGFAVRGMGASASIQNTGGLDAFGTGTGLTRVTEAFDLPNLIISPDISVSDALEGDNDGSFEPGETVSISVSLKNVTGFTANSVSAQIAGGGNAFYGSIANNGTASNSISYTIPSNSACGSALSITINVTSSLGPVSYQRTIQIGTSVQTFGENFDGVTTPSLPPGWTAVPIQNGINFVTSTNFANSAPNSAFALDPATIGGGTDLTTPQIPITAQAAILTFRNRFDTEASWDGGVVEISIGGAAFQDVIAAGGVFLQNGYNDNLGTGTNNPLSGRAAWSGNSNGYLTTSIRLPASAAGQNVQIKFRFGADTNTVGIGPNPGWYIDNVQVFGQASCDFTPTTAKSRADFDGDGRSDLSVFRPSDNNWYVVRSNGGIDVIQWGIANDQIVPGRYDGDDKTDFAVFRPSESKWYVLGSDGFTVSTYSWGIAGDRPVVGDYNGDGRNDPAVFRPSDNKWYILYGSGAIQVQEWGLTGDIPVPADFNGDEKTDFGVYRNGAWHVALTSGGNLSVNWGLPNDRPVPADFDGDDKDDFAVWRPSDGKWYIGRSLDGGVEVFEWGLAGDIPVPGDFDGDGRDEPSVFRNGTWFLLRSTAGISVVNWGLAGDVPILSGYIPAPPTN